MKKTIFIRGILALVFLSFALTNRAQQKAVRPPAGIHRNTVDGRGYHEILDVEDDSTANPPRTIIMYKSDSMYNMVLVEGKLVEMYVNGRKMPADNFYLYDDLVRRLKKQIEKDRAQAIVDQQQAARDQIQAERDGQQARVDAQQAEKDALQAEIDAKQAKNDAEQVVRDKVQAEKDVEQDREQARRDKVQAERDAVQVIQDKKQAERDAQQAVQDREQARRDKIQAEEDKALVKSLMAEVVKQGLAPDEKSVVSLILDESVFFINGKKQSDELQMQFRKKYIKKAGYSIYFHHGGTQMGVISQ